MARSPTSLKLKRSSPETLNLRFLVEPTSQQLPETPEVRGQNPSEISADLLDDDGDDVEPLNPADKSASDGEDSASLCASQEGSGVIVAVLVADDGEESFGVGRTRRDTLAPPHKGVGVGRDSNCGPGGGAGERPAAAVGNGEVLLLAVVLEVVETMAAAWNLCCCCSLATATATAPFPSSTASTLSAI